MASKTEWESMRLALGPLYDDRRLTGSIHRYDDPSLCWADFEELADNHFIQATMSETEMMLLGLAETLYRGTARSFPFDLGRLISWTDNETWTRCMKAIALRRGVSEPIDAGQWIGSFG